jgi:hypothetical protein
MQSQVDNTEFLKRLHGDDESVLVEILQLLPSIWELLIKPSHMPALVQVTKEQILPVYPITETEKIMGRTLAKLWLRRKSLKIDCDLGAVLYVLLRNEVRQLS